MTLAEHDELEQIADDLGVMVKSAYRPGEPHFLLAVELGDWTHCPDMIAVEIAEAFKRRVHRVLGVKP